MRPAAVHALAADHVDHEAAIIATAIAWAESGLDPEAVGDESLIDDTWGPSIGLWQIRSLRADTGTGRPRDRTRLTDPEFNARAMAAISNNGTYWGPWSVFTNGRYLKHLDAVRAAVEGGRVVEVVTRAQWGARQARGRTAAPGMTSGVAVHWLGETGAPRTHADCAGTMRWVQNLHMDSNGWVDYAYNAGACPHGVVFEGRGPKVRNAANGGGTRNGADANGAWAAILYFDALNDGLGLTPEGMDAINDAAVWLGVADGEWLGHRDFLSTGCPGDETYAWVHSGHPRGSTAPTPDEEEDDMSYFGDSPDGRPYGFWLVDGCFRKRLHTTDVWDEQQELAKRLGRKAPEHVGKIPVATFDALIDVDELARAVPAK